MITKLRAVACSILIILGGGIATTSASASPASDRSAAYVTKAGANGKTVYTIHVPHGADSSTVHIPERIGQLDSKGCSGNVCVVVKAGAHSTARDHGTIGPLDAYGCSGWVCIKLDSTPDNSTYIDGWTTTALNDKPMCTNAFFLINNSIVRGGDTLCADDAGTFVSFWNANRRWPDGSEACNRWRGYPVPEHKPCKEITN